MTVRLFGSLDGEPVHAVTLRSKAGAEADVMSWGAVVRDLRVPARAGPQRVVLGLDSLDDYVAHSPHFGAIAGRYANRIAGGRFSLDGVAYRLPRNQENRHSLHGGGHGFGKRPWRLAGHDGSSATLVLFSPDGDAGYPGDLLVSCTYRLVEPATLRVELTATAGQATPINLCHHSYFNLDGSPDIGDHVLEVAADFITPTDSDLIPTGEIWAVAGTSYDFRHPRPVRLADENGSRVRYDTNFVLRRDRADPAGLAHAATFASARSGLAMEVWTTEPGLQVYDGHKTRVPAPGLDGAAYGPFSGLCLEPQHFPDSPNRAHFPSAVLRPGEVYRQVTEYRFG